MENSNNKDINPNLQQGAVSGSINLSEKKTSYAVKKGLVSQEKINKPLSNEWKDKIEGFYPKVGEMRGWTNKLS